MNILKMVSQKFMNNNDFKVFNEFYKKSEIDYELKTKVAESEEIKNHLMKQLEEKGI